MTLPPNSRGTSVGHSQHTNVPQHTGRNSWCSIWLTIITRSHFFISSVNLHSIWSNSGCGDKWLGGAVGGAAALVALYVALPPAYREPSTALCECYCNMHNTFLNQKVTFWLSKGSYRSELCIGKVIILHILIYKLDCWVFYSKELLCGFQQLQE